MFGPINKFHHESPVSFKYQGIWLEGKVCFVAYLRSGHFLYDLRTRDEERNNQSMRIRIKHFIQDLVDPRTGTRSGSAGGEIAGTGFGALVFQREGGNPVNLTRRTVLEEEPGAILNSIEIATNTKGEDIVVSTVREPGPLVEVLPKIREDLRFQLHYLMAGDRFKAQFASRGRTRSLEYSLRPLSEGNSLISAPLASIRNEVF